MIEYGEYLAGKVNSGVGHGGEGGTSEVQVVTSPLLRTHPTLHHVRSCKILIHGLK